MLQMTDATSLADAREWLWPQLYTNEGGTCPCCGQHAQIYNRSIHAGTAVALMRIYVEWGQKWFRTRELNDESKHVDITPAKLWDFIEHDGDDRKPSQRRWRLTARGKAFVEDDIRIPKWARMYNDKIIEFHGPKIGIRDALGKRFHYEDLVGW